MFGNKYKSRIENKIAELKKQISAIESEYKGVKETLEPEKYCHFWLLKKGLDDDIKLLNELL